MIERLTLTSFRNHNKKEFTFKPTTVIVGRNTAGKTNILEAIHFLASGKSFKADRDQAAVQYEKDFAKVEGQITNGGSSTKLAVILAFQNSRPSKKFTVDSLPKKISDFVSNFTSVLFTPTDIDVISGAPSFRRKYIDNILQKTKTGFLKNEKEFEKALKKRNKMLQDIKREVKFYSDSDFEYWDNLVIAHGQQISDAREELVKNINSLAKDIFEFRLHYDKSEISKERLAKYHSAERAVGQTLVGPTRDDFVFFFGDRHEVKEYGSRGEQRLTILQVKVLEIQILTRATGSPPTLLLDDIFSELDEDNIEKIYELIQNQQTIITTTHEEFIPEDIKEKKGLSIIHL